jgi:hypothetical protein
MLPSTATSGETSFHTSECTFVINYYAKSKQKLPFTYENLRLVLISSQVKCKYNNAYPTIKNHLQLVDTEFKTIDDFVQQMSSNPSVQIKLKTPIKYVFSKIELPKRAKMKE